MLAHRLAAVKAGDLRVLLGRGENAPELRVWLVGLFGDEEGGAAPDASSASGEHGRQAPSVGDAAGSNDWQGRDRADCLRDERQGPEAAGVAARLRALRNDGVNARLGDALRVLHVPHEGEDHSAAGVQPLDPGCGAAEPRGEDWHALLDDDLHLRVGHAAALAAESGTGGGGDGRGLDPGDVEPGEDALETLAHLGGHELAGVGGGAACLRLRPGSWRAGAGRRRTACR